jgi:hypothetical protein
VVNKSVKTFKPTYLYIKQCRSTGLKYFGKTIAKDPIKYKGSGKYWIRHINRHGNNVETIWYKLFTDKDELVRFATQFSSQNNIVESSEWANLKIEDGLWGGGVKGLKLGPMSDDHKEKISKSVKRKLIESGWVPKPAKVVDPDGRKWKQQAKEKLSETRKGRTPWNKGKSIGSYIENRKRCDRCNNYFAPYTLRRWHGDKCKSAAFGD